MERGSQVGERSGLQDTHICGAVNVHWARRLPVGFGMANKFFKGHNVELDPLCASRVDRSTFLPFSHLILYKLPQTHFPRILPSDMSIRHHLLFCRCSL